MLLKKGPRASVAGGAAAEFPAGSLLPGSGSLPLGLPTAQGSSQPTLSVTLFQPHCVCWQKLFPTMFAHFMSLGHILVLVAIFQTFSLLLYLLQ